MRIAECTGCDELCQAVEKNQVLVFNWLYDTTLGNPPPPLRWHAQLAEALVSGDPEIADSAARRHTRYRMDEVLQRMDPYFSFTEARLAAFPNRPRRDKSRNPRTVEKVAEGCHQAGPPMQAKQHAANPGAQKQQAKVR